MLAGAGTTPLVGALEDGLCEVPPAAKLHLVPLQLVTLCLCTCAICLVCSAWQLAPLLLHGVWVEFRSHCLEELQAVRLPQAGCVTAASCMSVLPVAACPTARGNLIHSHLVPAAELHGAES